MPLHHQTKAVQTKADISTLEMFRMTICCRVLLLLAVIQMRVPRLRFYRKI